ncbi:hypothetical protein MYAM1_000212 [Malassezia yamatoensis]|uniref:Asl1-like glycosyl hydrolase catalytic domain-containing protein n=1 Tax=Malassezia yamatoensis TaxID=253288 RepID=A0AAJ6CGC1_9BASI|nr:hypothetical protein MYAM1_000212 [Malassezia yamatoensis]
MKLPLSTILVAMMLASAAQAAPIHSNPAAHRRDMARNEQAAMQRVAAGLNTLANEFVVGSSTDSYDMDCDDEDDDPITSSSSSNDSRNAAVVDNTEWVNQGSATAGVSSTSAGSSQDSSALATGTALSSSRRSSRTSSLTATDDTSLDSATETLDSDSDTASATDSMSDSGSDSMSDSDSDSLSDSDLDSDTDTLTSTSSHSRTRTGSLSSSATSTSTGSSGNSTSSSSPFSRSGKLGLAWPNGSSMNINKWVTDKVSWYYSWAPTPGWSNAPTNISFCPMLWGNKNLKSFQKNVLHNTNGKYNQAKCVMGMNEVNQAGQADMSVSSACSMMRENILPLKEKGWYVVSPVTTSAPNGQTWMDNFRSDCSDVWEAIDAVAVHYYDTSITKFKKYVTTWHNRYEKPIWVTEYACQNFGGGSPCSESHAKNFQTTMASWFDEQDFVQAYSPFGVMQDMQGVSSYNQMANGKNPSPLYASIAE